MKTYFMKTNQGSTIFMKSNETRNKRQTAFNKQTLLELLYLRHGIHFTYFSFFNATVTLSLSELQNFENVEKSYRNFIYKKVVVISNPAPSI